MVTQVILTDKNGIFTYAAPKAGWWGFSALTTADYKLKQGNEEKSVEVGGVIWVKFLPWITK
jgi:cobalt/nickel transport protein